MASVSFGIVDRFEGWAAAPEAVKSLIETYQSRRMLEVGSGANPTLDPGFVGRKGIEYTVNDISETELEKADSAYRRLVMDVSRDEPGPNVRGQFDFIFSRMVNEHVEDGERYYRHLHEMLMPGGLTVHWFSTLYALPFVANKLMPEGLSDWLLRTFAPRDSHKHGKFKAHYSWSRGPSRRMIRKFESLGFEVLGYTGYFGHDYYRRRSALLHRLEQAKSRWLVRHPIPALTSYAQLIMRRP